MSHRTFGARSPRTLSSAALAALDAGLHVAVDTDRSQRLLFGGAEHLSVQALASELAQMVSSLRIRSFSVRADIEELTLALLHNLECGFWIYARRAALDLSEVLASAGKHRVADRELCIRGANVAVHVAALCVTEACR